MKTTILRNTMLLIGLIALICALAVIPGELLISILIFAAIYHGGVRLIKLAASHDLKAKEIRMVDTHSNW